MASRPRDPPPMIAGMSLVDRAWPVLRPLMGYHAQVYRLTRGRNGHRFPGGPPMLLLDHVGAKSATKRTTPLVYVEDPPNLVIVASKGGAPEHPAWFRNLEAHPDAEIQVRDEVIPVRASVAEGEERQRLWSMMTEVWPAYDDYQAKTDRQIPVVVLARR